MKIVKKTSSNSGLFLAILPTLTYGISKLCGKVFNNGEYIWWIVIPSLWIIFLATKYKVVKE